MRWAFKENFELSITDHPQCYVLNFYNRITGDFYSHLLNCQFLDIYLLIRSITNSIECDTLRVFMSNIPDTTETSTQSIITIDVPISLYIKKQLNIQFQLFHQHTNVPPLHFIPDSQYVVEPIELVDNNESTVMSGLISEIKPIKRKAIRKKTKTPKKPKSGKPKSQYVPKTENGRYKHKKCRQCLIKKPVEEFNRSKIYVYEPLCKICQESYIKLGNQYFHKTIKYDKCRRTNNY